MVNIFYADLQKDLMKLLLKINKAKTIIEEEEKEVIEIEKSIQKIYVNISNKRHFKKTI